MAAQAARLAKLEGNITRDDLVGTYAIHGFQNELRAYNNLSGPPPPLTPPRVDSYVFRGTVMLAADGSVSFGPGTEDGNGLRVSGPPMVFPIHRSFPGETLGTWTYPNGAVTVAAFGSFPLSVAAGGRVLIAAGANSADGTNVILIFSRLL